MRNIVLHAVVRGEADAKGDLARVLVAGHAFGLDLLLVRLEGPTGAVETAVGAMPRTHQWVARFDDLDALNTAGIDVAAKVRVVAADLDDPTGCYSAAETRVEVE
jgi:hypothetical protein